MREGRYYICYDSGESAGSVYLVSEIKPEEVAEAKLGESEELNVIRRAQSRFAPLKIRYDDPEMNAYRSLR